MRGAAEALKLYARALFLRFRFGDLAFFQARRISSQEAKSSKRVVSRMLSVV